MRTPASNKWRYRKQAGENNYGEQDIGYPALAMAIVRQAVEDYRYARKREKRAELIKKEEARKYAVWYWHEQQEEVIRFFRGSWYELLCDIDPELIIRRLKEERV